MFSRVQRMFGQDDGKQIVLLVIYCLVILVFPSLAKAHSDEPYFRQVGLRISKELPPRAKELESLLNGLRVCTGFTELRFEESGRLHLGDRKYTGGSNSARELLVAAVESQDLFIIENSNYSSTIAFAEIEPTDIYIDPANVKHEIWRVRLDFADFNHLRGGNRAINSFGPAIVLLHELGHGVLKKSDFLTKADQLGECERHTNVIRQELGLPQRENYQLRGRRGVSPGSSAESLQAEFRFSMTDEHNKKKTFVLAFDVDRVCDVVKIQSLPPGRAEIFLATR